MAITHAPSFSPTGATTPPAADGAVLVSALSKSYGNLHVLRDVSLEIARNEVFGLLGPNGAGKTTLVESIVGLRVPDAGTITVLGLDPLQHRERFTTRVAVQPQEATLFENVRVHEALDLFASFYPAPFATTDVLEQIGLTDSAGQLVRKLSGGQRRRLLLGVAMIGAPLLIVLDEPSAGLDPQARRALWDVIRRLKAHGTTVLLTTHHMDEAAELCDRVGFMIDGRIEALGTPGDLVAQRVGAQVVTFETGRAHAADVQERLRARPDVSGVEVEVHGGRASARVTTTDTDAVLALVVDSRSWRAHRLRVEEGDLEGLFLELTAGNESEGPPRPRHRSRTRLLPRKDHD